MNRSFVGQHSIIEYILAQAIGIFPDMEPQMQQLLKDSLSSYIHQTTSYENCSQLFCTCIGSSSPVDALKSILDCNIDQKEDAVTQDVNSSESNLAYDNSDDGSSQSGGRKRARPWNQQEDRRLLAGILRHGTDNWSLVSEIVGPSRTRAQCSQRWFRGLDPRISKKRWNIEEDKKLLEFVEEYGETAWAKIASSMGNRSDVQCRYHYQQLKKSTRKTSKHKASVQQSQKQTALGPEIYSQSKVQPIALNPLELNIPTLKANLGQKMPVTQAAPIKKVERQAGSFLAPIEPIGFFNKMMFPAATSSIDVFLHHFGF